MTPAQAADQCAVPDLMVQSQFRLTRSAAVLQHPGQKLTIVALGSSSTEGVGASGPSHTYPSLLQVDLSRRLGREVSVQNKGIGGQVATDMLTRLNRDVFKHGPDLVIWQTGTNDFLSHVPVQTFATALKAGIEQIRGVGIDVILLEPQVLPKHGKDDGYESYLETFRGVAAAEHVPNFRRFDVMRHWLTSGSFALKDMLSNDSLHMTDASYACLATRVGDMIESGVNLPAPRLVAGKLPAH